MLRLAPPSSPLRWGLAVDRVTQGSSVSLETLYIP
jgi:hypothetical protein